MIMEIIGILMALIVGARVYIAYLQYKSNLKQQRIDQLMDLNMQEIKQHIEDSTAIIIDKLDKGCHNNGRNNELSEKVAKLESELMEQKIAQAEFINTHIKNIEESMVGKDEIPPGVEFNEEGYVVDKVSGGIFDTIEDWKEWQSWTKVNGLSPALRPPGSLVEIPEKKEG
jgi:hypothetical protein